MKRWGWWVGGAVVIVGLLAFGLFGLQRARDFESLAQAGKADAKAALRSLEDDQLPSALANFQKARDEFGRARNLLGPDWLRGVPWIGRQLGAANDLSTIGLEGSTAGAAAADLLIHAESLTGGDRLSQLLKLARPQLDAALSSLVVVAQRVEGLSTDGLVPQLASALTEVRELTEPMELILHRSQAMLDLERYLFSKQHRFLVVAQNSSELRPTGGFMGSYGLLEMGPESFRLDRFADIYTLPRDTLNLPIPPGGQVNYKHFYFRNSNWWMDFPTSAKQMLVFWDNLAQPKVDGVLAVDIPLLRNLLEVHGPVTVPESTTPITAKNVMERLNELVQYEISGQADRKDRKVAVASLVAVLFDWVSNLPPEESRATLAALATSVAEKHIQLYVTDPAAQAAVVTSGWSGALDPPAGTTDLMAVSNGVVKPSKANIGVDKTLDYRVTLAGDGSADTTLTLGYRKSPKLYKGVPQQWLANYVRVHRLGDTHLVTGSDGFESLMDATELPTFGQYFRLDPGASTTVALHSRVPGAFRRGPVSASESPGGASSQRGAEAGHYRLLLVRQADLVDTAATVTVAVPQGWEVVGSAASFRVSGVAVKTTSLSGAVSVETPLTQDLLLDVTLVKA